MSINETATINVTALETINLDNLYSVLGRVKGEDDDTHHIVEAENQGDADSKFSEQLRMECGGDGDTDVYICSSLPLRVEIEERLNGMVTGGASA